jgi:hypothetical protein
LALRRGGDRAVADDRLAAEQHRRLAGEAPSNRLPSSTSRSGVTSRAVAEIEAGRSSPVAQLDRVDALPSTVQDGVS